MSEIRVTYAGLISLAIKLVSIITGLVFTLIVTRELTQEEFGTWGLISGLLIYVLIFEPIISFWTTREIARGNEIGKTAFITNGAISIIGVVVYIIISFLVGFNSEAEQKILVFAAILVPAIFLHNTLNAINVGWKPQVVSYGFLVFEIVKIPLAIIFVYNYDLGVEGAILATCFAHITSIGTLLFFARTKIRAKFKVGFIKKCLKSFWIPTYRDIPPLLFTSDIVVFTLVTGSVTGIAFYVAARTISYIVMNVNSFSSALYPKFLAGGKQEYLKDNLNKLFYFAFPMMAVSIIFARAGLFTLNPVYEAAYSVVIVLTFRAFLSALNKTFYQVLQGIEQVDKNENSTFIDYLKSKLFWLPTIRLIQYSSYIGTLVIVLLIFKTSTELELVLLWSFVALIVEIPVLIYLIIYVRRFFSLRLDFKGICKYLGSAVLVFTVLFFLVENYLEYKISIFEFLPNLMLFAAGGIGGYLLITYLIDSKTRQLFHAIINELKRKSVP